jgi:hypothetical protein
VTFNSRKNAVILGKNMKILNQSDKMKKVFNQPPIVSFRRDKTLKLSTLWSIWQNWFPTGSSIFPVRIFEKLSSMRWYKVSPICPTYIFLLHFVQKIQYITPMLLKFIDKIHREVKESLWIKKLKTYEPLGLNTKMERH